MKGIDFSFVVPAYNVSPYIVDCLRSIKEQSGSFECIVVDDGSTDSTGNFAREFCEKEDNFFYFYKENGGLSSARNYGLSKAIGKYIVFVDSDDYISKDLLSYLRTAFFDYKAGFVCFNYKEVSGFFEFPSNNIIVRKIENRDLYKLPNFACIRVLDREFYNQNNFPVGVIYEDVVTSSIANFLAKESYFIDVPLYFYRRRAGSITTGNVKNQFKLFSALKELRERVIRKGIPLIVYDSAFVGLSKSILVSLIRLDDNKDYDFFSKKCIDNIKNVGLLDALRSYASAKNKFYFILLKSNFFISFFLKKTRSFIRVLDKKR